MVIVDFCPLSGRSGHEGAYALLERMVLRHTGRPMPEILRTPMGKPYFPGDPVYFSLSHTKNYAFCALSSQPVGIDAEELDRRVNPRLARQILSPGEYGRYEACRDRNEALLRLWVLKEARGKCSGRGISAHPNDTDFSPDDPRIRVVSGCVVAVVTGECPKAQDEL